MSFDLAELWGHMTIIVKILTIFMIATGIFSIYVIFDRLTAYGAAGKQGNEFVQLLGEHLKQHKVKEAHVAARASTKSPVATTMAAGLNAYIQGRGALATQGSADVGDFDLVDAVNRALERVKERETSHMRKGLGFLGTVATATPFIGLLGTVIGIINAFGQLKNGAADFGVISGSISEALVSTAVGLFFAIVAAIGFNYCTTKVESFVIDMNDVSSEFIDYVLREGRSA